MSLVGLDLNAGRVRAVIGPSSGRLAVVSLEQDQVELPLLLFLEDRGIQIGRTAFAQLRQRPHQVCSDFLPALGTDRVWQVGKQRLNPAEALSAILAALPSRIGRTAGIAATLPAYLGEHQLQSVYQLAANARLPLLGSVTTPVAAVLSSPVAQDSASDPGLILVVESDSFSLTWSIVERADGVLRLRFIQPSPTLGRWTWARKLLDGIADRCVRQCRRDPRESAATEQRLFEQIVRLLDQSGVGLVQMHLQGTNWSHHLMLHADELPAFVAPQLRQVVSDIDTILAAVEPLGTLSAVVLTQPAAGLPGLETILRSRMQSIDQTRKPRDDQDFGDSLLAATDTSQSVHTLPLDALASMAHELAVRIHGGDFPRGHLDAIALPGGASTPTNDTGPARLSYRGEDHMLSSSPFMLGRDPGCNLVFETELYPHVSARHCEIIFDRRAYVLYDRSRHGTWLNDQRVEQQQALHSGDWIRLGPLGPVLRFLGQSGDTSRSDAIKTNW